MGGGFHPHRDCRDNDADVELVRHPVVDKRGKYARCQVQREPVLDDVALEKRRRRSAGRVLRSAAVLVHQIHADVAVVQIRTLERVVGRALEIEADVESAATSRKRARRMPIRRCCSGA
jgi:hypothetical protein